ncbi:hypothetical protein CK203_063720 [Vitis vinifera]|uniref:Uncharacterized protein n=1 Tax=Vitis vinifera TaxID=29760 RepID=A0A438GA29_VITVI|nr:hypothetical protein CK203_063720 [Vitis vinifera]
MATKEEKSNLPLVHISYGEHQRGHIDLSASSEARPSASAPQDPFQASQALTVPSSKGRVPSSPPQCRPSGIAPEVIIKRPMVTTPLIPGNSDCRAKPFHFELYFDMEAMRQQPNLRDSFGLLQRYHLKCLMTPREFFYPRVAIDFYRSHNYSRRPGVPQPFISA